MVRTNRDNPGAFSIWAPFMGLAIVLPIASVLSGHWLLGVSLPSLMFVSFVLLFIGSVVCWPGETTPSEGVILLILGQSSAVGVLILFFIRLWEQGLLFQWM